MRESKVQGQPELHLKTLPINPTKQQLKTEQRKRTWKESGRTASDSLMNGEEDLKNFRATISNPMKTINLWIQEGQQTTCKRNRGKT